MKNCFFLTKACFIYGFINDANSDTLYLILYCCNLKSDNRSK